MFSWFRQWNKFWKSVNIWWSKGIWTEGIQKSVPVFLGHPISATCLLLKPCQLACNIRTRHHVDKRVDHDLWTALCLNFMCCMTLNAILFRFFCIYFKIHYVTPILINEYKWTKIWVSVRFSVWLLCNYTICMLSIFNMVRVRLIYKYSVVVCEFLLFAVGKLTSPTGWLKKLIHFWIILKSYLETRQQGLVLSSSFCVKEAAEYYRLVLNSLCMT